MMKRTRNDAKGHGRSPRWRGWVLGLALASLAGACSAPATDAIDGAEKALLNASFAKDCEGDSYRLAEQMLADARQANAEGDHETARKKAEAARMLADQAKQNAEISPCDARLEEKIAAVIDETPPDDGSGGFDQAGQEYALETIYFPFDQATLTLEAKQTLNTHADWLSKNQSVKLVIEGHTDDSGSIEYNLALSQRRGQVVKQYLKRLGVEEGRLRVVPFGEERPEIYGHDDSARSRNRRAAFITR